MSNALDFTTPSDYQQFLASKSLQVASVGKPIDKSALHPVLFPFQADLTRWAVAKGRCAIFADVGLGKTVMQLEWARQLGVMTLIIAPLAVAQQTIRMAKTLLGLEVCYVRSDSEALHAQLENPALKLFITNYERIDDFNAALFQAVVLDECFAAGTPIDVVSEDGTIYTKHIEEIRKGDKIINAAGVDTVSDVHRREVKYAVKINIAGQSVIASPNHPFFTQRGWVSSQNLRPGDAICRTREAMRMVQQAVPGSASRRGKEAVLRDILLSEMAYAPAGYIGEGSQSGSRREARSEEISMAQSRIAGSAEANRAYSEFKSDAESGESRESLPHIESDEAQTFRAWGKWDGIDAATIEAAGGAWSELAGGIRFITGKTSSGLSDTLQAGLSQSADENLYRSGWAFSSGETLARRKTDSKTEFVGVDGIEILELGHPDLDQLRDADGKLYFYDIGATQHPSFSIGGLLVHNSSILKNMVGVTKKKLCDMFAHTPYRLCCTATPAPNDVTELGSHAEFLGIMTNAQMTSLFFVHEAGVFAGVKDSRWRLKKHAEKDFYRWLASWSAAIKKPSDLGYSDDGYDLPRLEMHLLTVQTDYTPAGMLPGMGSGAISATDAGKVRRTSIAERGALAAQLVNGNSDQWIVWTGLNDEAHHLATILEGSINVHGSLSVDAKIDGLVSFVEGRTRVLVTKASIAGLGINMQQCSKMIFFGIDFSWESFYQAIGRIYRFGQLADHVDVYIITSEQERPIYRTIERKAEVARTMTQALIDECAIYSEVKTMDNHDQKYVEDVAAGAGWTMLLGDSCERMKELADDSVHLSVYSPPFSDMYIYNNTPRDLSNSTDFDQFFDHYAFVIRENLRITIPGRLACVHVNDTKAFKNRHGYRGILDFSGEVIEAYIKEGWIFRARITIDKNPQIVASRNKDSDLLFITGKRDSTDLAPMIPDYLLIFKKPGDNPVPVTPYANHEMTEDEWISWAHAIWYDISETDVLNVRVARADADEKHMCPLQLPLIERALKLWSNPGETIFSPFAGIGSEIYSAVKLGRKGIGIELKPEYWRQANKNIGHAEQLASSETLFGYMARMEMTDGSEEAEDVPAVSH